jgi:hypothetical protein
MSAGAYGSLLRCTGKDGIDLKINILIKLTVDFCNFTCNEDTTQVKICMIYPEHTEIILNKKDGSYKVGAKLKYILDKLENRLQFHVEYLDMNTQSFKVTTNYTCDIELTVNMFKPVTTGA